jgi:phage gp36-like protein
MSYATPQNLLQWYGGKELAQTATPDDLVIVPAQLMRLTIDGGNRDAFSQEEIASADSALERITAALAEATLLIESYISRRYELPITENVVQASPLPRSCGAMARRLLYDDAVPQEVENRYEHTLGWLRDLANNRADLCLNTTIQGQVGTGLADFESKERIFDNTSLQGFITSQDYQS